MGARAAATGVSRRALFFLKALERQETYVAGPAATGLGFLGSKDPEVTKAVRSAAHRAYPMADGTSRPAIELIRATIFALSDLKESTNDFLPLLASQAKFHKSEVVSLFKEIKGRPWTSTETKHAIDGYLKELK